MSTQDVDIDALVRGRRRPRRVLYLLVLATVAVIAVLAWFLTQGEEEEAVFEPQRVTATSGRLTTTLELSGSAEAAQTASLSFAAGGEVAEVAAQVGDEVAQGDVLARLDTSDAERQLETAEIQLRLAQLRLEDLLESASAAEIAASERSLANAEAQLVSAAAALDELQNPPDPGDIAGAEQALANALVQVSNAAQALADLTEDASAAQIARATQAVANAESQLSAAREALADLIGEPTATELASAEQAVANARGQLSQAEESLESLSDEPSAAEIATAEQAVASAASQLLSAEQAYSALTEEPSVAELETARSNALQARVPVSNAEETLTAAEYRLERAHEDFCDDIVVLPEICDAPPPLPESEIELLESKTENSGSTLERRARELISAQLGWETASNSYEAAVSALAAAEARLDALLDPDPDAVEQARESFEAAQASHAAARARLDELVAPPTDAELYRAEQAVAAARGALEVAEGHLDDLLSPAEDDDVFRAEQAVAAAQAGLDAAQAELDDLLGDADPDDVFQAQQSLTAARSHQDAAQATLDELLAPATEEDVLEAELALLGAQSSLDEARARHDELMTGATGNAIAQQQENVRLAEISVEQARSAMDDLLIKAPFAGVVEQINVNPGDRVGSGATAIVISTPDQVIVSLTVTEAEIFELADLQVGVALFDAIEGVQYPVQITTISRVPNVEQGVVTYAVEATVLSPPEIQQVRDELTALGVTVPEPRPAAAQGAQAGGEGGGAGANPQQAARFQAFLQSLDLPEGVTVLQVVQAIANDDPLPEGVELPEEFEITDEQRAQLRAVLERFTGGGGASAAGGRAAIDDDRQLPVDGMSATVILLTAVRDESVLLPTSAVRQIEGALFVAVSTSEPPGWERIEVQIGESDGTDVEILSGLASGDTVLVGVDSDGIAYSATQLPSGGAAGGLGGGLPGAGGAGRAGGG